MVGKSLSLFLIRFVSGIFWQCFYNPIIMDCVGVVFFVRSFLTFFHHIELSKQNKQLKLSVKFYWRLFADFELFC